ncbi:RNA-binding protein [Aphelenchoides avenae]|nr:RNA-binding protein [Aphelenchus avenae]
MHFAEARLYIPVGYADSRETPPVFRLHARHPFRRDEPWRPRDLGYHSVHHKPRHRLCAPGTMLDFLRATADLFLGERRPEAALQRRSVQTVIAMASTAAALRSAAHILANSSEQITQQQQQENSVYTSPNGQYTSGSTTSSSPTNSDSMAESKTNLIINYLPQTMSQDEVRSLFASMGEIESCKLVRDKVTGQSLGYAFVNYCREEDARRALGSLNGLRLQNKTIKVSPARPSSEQIKGANLYVSGLPKTLTQSELEEIFRPYGNIVTSRILFDNVTGLSKGVGFVRFDTKGQAEAAIEKLNGTMPPGFSEPVQVKFANNPASSSQKTVLQMAQAASSLLPLTLMQTAAATTALRGAPLTVGGPMHHTPQLGRFRYSPIGTMTGGLAGTNTISPAMAAVQPTSVADFYTTQALLQMAAAAGIGAAPPAQFLGYPMTASVAQSAAQQATNAAVLGNQASTSPAAGYSIFVHNLAPETEDSGLWRLFGPFGAVLSVKVVKDPATNKCKGFGFVDMANYQDAINAITGLNGATVNNRVLQVAFKNGQTALLR